MQNLNEIYKGFALRKKELRLLFVYKRKNFSDGRFLTIFDRKRSSRVKRKQLKLRKYHLNDNDTAQCEILIWLFC